MNKLILTVALLTAGIVIAQEKAAPAARPARNQQMRQMMSRLHGQAVRGGLMKRFNPRSFGKLSDGRETKIYTLQGMGGLRLDVTDYGGRVVRVYAPDRHGNLADVTLGWNTAAEYEKNGFSMGTLIGRFGNRIKDGKFTLDGKDYQLPINETKPEPRHCTLHGGPEGWHTKIWKVSPIREPMTAGLEFSLTSEDGDMGFPGKVECKVAYRVLADNTWRIDYEATTDKPTVLNLTQHGYWNLAGEASGNVLGQELQIFADFYTKTDDGLIPVEHVPVKGTGFDFTELRPIGAKAEWMAKCAAIKCTNNWYDHNFVLRGNDVGVLHQAVLMRDPVSGRKMEIWTTEPCLQVYGSQNFDGTMNTKAAGGTLQQYAGIVFETQHAPDSPNHPDWPTVTLRPGETFKSATEYRFSAE